MGVVCSWGEGGNKNLKERIYFEQISYYFDGFRGEVRGGGEFTGDQSKTKIFFNFHVFSFE